MHTDPAAGRRCRKYFSLLNPLNPYRAIDYFHVQMQDRDSLAAGRRPANIHNNLSAVAHRGGGI